MQETTDVNSRSCSHRPVSVIVCTTNTRQTILRCLHSILAEQCAHAEILVVLNGPWSNDVAQQLHALPVRLLHEPRRGVSLARNRALWEAEGELLLILDDDVVVHSGWLHETVKGFTEPSIACVVGRVIPEGTIYENGPGGRKSYEQEAVMKGWTFGPEHGWFRKVLRGEVAGFGCNMAFRKSFLLECSKFPYDLGAGSVIGSGDENYMFLQVVKHGYRIQHVPSACVTHIDDKNRSQQKERLKQLRQAAVAFHLKLLLEESGHRWEVLRNLATGGRRFLQSSANQGTYDADLMTFWERLSAYARGLLLYWESRKWDRRKDAIVSK